RLPAAAGCGSSSREQCDVQVRQRRDASVLTAFRETSTQRSGSACPPLQERATRPGDTLIRWLDTCDCGSFWSASRASLYSVACSRGPTKPPSAESTRCAGSWATLRRTPLL